MKLQDFKVGDNVISVKHNIRGIIISAEDKEFLIEAIQEGFVFWATGSQLLKIDMKYDIKTREIGEKDMNKKDLEELMKYQYVINAVADVLMDRGFMEQEPDVGEVVVVWDDNDAKIVGILAGIDTDSNSNLYPYPYLVGAAWFKNCRPYDHSKTVEENLV